MTRKPLPEITETWVIRPGEKLLVRVPDDTLTEEEIHEIKDRIHEEWPDVPLIVMSDRLMVSVIRVDE